MKTVEVKVSELEGAALDWAVAKAEGWSLVRVPKDIDGNNGGYTLAPPDFSKNFQFPPRGSIPPNWLVRHWSTDWSQGGPLIDKYRIAFHALTLERGFDASISGDWDYSGFTEDEINGSTHLIAACRAIVAANMGDTVQIPAELA